MDPQLSNAVSHAFLRVLDATIHHTEWKSFLLIFGSTSWEQVDAVFTLYWFLKWHCLLPKGQQKLTRFSDLVEEGLSYLQLFLELPETVWSLWNCLYIKKHVKWFLGSPFVKANLSFGLIYEVESRTGYPEMLDPTGFWGFFIYILLLNVKNLLSIVWRLPTRHFEAEDPYFSTKNFWRV